MEAIKLIAKVGTTLAGRMLHYDATDGRMREITLRPDPHCALCGECPSITEPLAYGETCSAPGELQEIDATTAHGILEEGFDGILLDVREKDEHDWAHIEGCRLTPLSEFGRHLADLPRDRHYLVYCKMGQRSAHAGRAMLEAGFPHVTNLGGGIVAWIQSGAPVITR